MIQYGNDCTVWILRIGTFNLYWTLVFAERKEFVNRWFILLGKNEIVGCVAEVNSVLTIYVVERLVDEALKVRTSAWMNCVCVFVCFEFIVYRTWV